MSNEEFVRHMERNTPDFDPAMRKACENALIDSMFMAQRVRFAMKKLMESGQEDAALALMSEAVEQGIRPCKASDVRAWFEHFKTTTKFPQVEKLTVLAIRSGVQGLTSEDIRNWMQVLFDNKKPVHVGPIFAEDYQNSQIAAFSDEETLSLVRTLFDRNCPTGAVDITLLAFEKEGFRSGIREDDLRQWIASMFEKHKSTNIARLGAAVLDHRTQFTGIADEEVLDWIQKLKDYMETVQSRGVTLHVAVDKAGLLQVAAFANGVHGIMVQDIAETIVQVFHVEDSTENTQYAMQIVPLLTAAMTRMSGVHVDEFPIARLLDTRDDRTVILALMAIECNLPGITAAKIREWADICMKWKPVNYNKEYNAAQILAKAFEKNVPGMDRVYDLRTGKLGDEAFASFHAEIVFGAASMNEQIDSISAEAVAQHAENWVNAGSIQEVGSVTIPAIESGRLILTGSKLMSLVNTLLEKGAKERAHWKARIAEFSDEELKRPNIAVIYDEAQQHLNAGLHAKAFEVLIAGLDKGYADGIMPADILRVKKEFDNIDRGAQALEVLIAAKEAGIAIPEELMRASEESYLAHPLPAGYDLLWLFPGTGSRVANLYRMYQRHSRAQRQHPELAALVAELSDPVEEKIMTLNLQLEEITRERVGQMVCEMINCKN